MAEYKTFTVNYLLDEREQQALEELLPYWQQYTNEKNERPFKDWKVEDVFKATMEIGSKYTIADKLQNEQLRQGLIEWEEREKDGFKTVEERKRGTKQ